MKAIYENEKMTASTNGKYVSITIKASKASTNVSPINGKIEIKPVTDPRYLDALKKQNLDPASRVMLGTACVPTDAAEIIVSAFADAAAELAADPKEIMNRLIEERRNLVIKINGLADDDYQASHRAMQRAVDSSRYSAPKTDNSAKIAELREALATFDAAHPEVKTEIEDRKQADIERNMWN